MNAPPHVLTCFSGALEAMSVLSTRPTCQQEKHERTRHRCQLRPRAVLECQDLTLIALTRLPVLTGTYALYLPILAGMSGGGVFTSDKHLFATNDFSYTPTACSSTEGCYNGGAAHQQRSASSLAPMLYMQHCQASVASCLLLLSGHTV